MCLIIYLVKRLLIKLGWLKPSAADAGCGIPSVAASYSHQARRNERPAGG